MLILAIAVTPTVLCSLQTLHMILVAGGYECLEMNIPILCFGDGRDMELTLSSDTNTATPLATKVSSVLLFVVYSCSCS